MNKILFISCFAVLFGIDNQSLIDDAINSYTDLLEEDPNNYEVEYNIGNLNYYKNNYEEAINKYNQALKTKDSLLQSDIYYNLGNTHFNLGDYQKSREYYKKSLKANPSNQDARYNYEFVNKIIKKDQDQDQQDQNQDGDQDQDQQDQNQDADQTKDPNKSPEQILEKEEAEAILNSLKANEKNMMKRRYFLPKTVKVLKDW